MAITIGRLSRLLSSGGIRHHVDLDEGVIHVVFVTRCYDNRRGERLAILRVAVAEEGCTCRVSLEQAFAAGKTAAQTCLALCRGCNGAVSVALEEDTASRTFRLVAAVPVEDGRLTLRQLGAVLDSVVAAAEAGTEALASVGRLSVRGAEDRASRGRRTAA